jgi:hypothetical protein
MAESPIQVSLDDFPDDVRDVDAGHCPFCQYVALLEQQPRRRTYQQVLADSYAFSLCHRTFNEQVVADGHPD